MNYLWLLGIAVILLFAAPVLAADSYTVENTGFMSVQSNPASADVYLNGLYYGKTPITVPDLDSGRYTVRIIKAGYFPVVQDNVNVNSGTGAATASVTADLRKDNANGGLVVYATPAGAMVSVDGESVGIIPKGIEVPLEVTGLSPGPHTIRIEAPGYEPVTKNNYEITAKNTETLRAALQESVPAAVETKPEMTSAPTASATIPPAPTKGFLPAAGFCLGILGGAVLLHRRT
jgi:hypothetical protein